MSQPTAAHLSSVFLPTSSIQPLLVPPVITHALVVRTAALRPRWKEAASCFNTRIAGPDGQALLFANYLKEADIGVLAGHLDEAEKDEKKA